MYTKQRPSRDQHAMSPVHIVPVSNHPFESPDERNSYFCNLCQSYSSDFYKSAINSGYRRCRACHSKTLARKSRSPVENLVRKLKYNLRYKGEFAIAKGVTAEHVVEILKLNAIDDPGQVKTIVPSFSNGGWDYKVVLKSVG